MVFRMLFLGLASAASLAGAAAAADYPKIPDPLAPMVAQEVTVYGRPHGPDVLGTATLNAGVTIYNARFRRVAADPLTDPRVMAIAASLRGLPPEAMLAAAKRAVEARVRFTTDLDAMGVSDYWDEASDTLRRGKGDGEDIAIAEMQVLRAAGYDPDSLWISVGRHKRIGAHAVLFAKTPDGFEMLDATERAPLDVDGRSAGQFVPIFSIGTHGALVHGVRYTAR